MEAIIMKMSPKNSTVIVEMERDGEGFYIIQSDLEKQRENSSLFVCNMDSSQSSFKKKSGWSNIQDLMKVILVAVK